MFIFGFSKFTKAFVTVGCSWVVKGEKQLDCKRLEANWVVKCWKHVGCKRLETLGL